ncbi:MAG: hypothetical protein JSV44_09610 [Candidatus Zixiibacteriota bacterium]|nr:MAG: hypothetical protein JSV44_09610 [candidate division Zixibacteria bacterium]
MKFLRLIGLLAGAFFVTGSVSMAQISEGGTPYSFSHATRTARADLATSAMPAVDVAAYLAEDSIEQEKGVPFRFGAAIDVNYTLENSGSWEILANGDRLWRMRITSPGAYSLNLLYDRFWIPDSASLFLYDETGSFLIGAFTARNNKDHGEFATGLIKGDVAILEYYEPARVAEQGDISIWRVVHGYRNLFDYATAKEAAGFGDAGACNNNVNCPEGEPWQDQIRSIAMVLTSSGTRICSGAMINNVRQDQAPLFLTADHCLGSESSWIFMFNYESPTCENIDGPTWYTVQGSTRLANFLASDFALLQLQEQPPDSYNIYFAGWSATDIAPTSSTGIHHPSGDIKKISFDYDPATSTEYLGSNPGGTHWRIGSWDDGTTESGSSGSPLFDQNHRIIGQLHGGYASCTSITSDWYGKLARSWEGGGTPETRLKDWLDPDNTGTMFLDGYDTFAGTEIAHTPLLDTRDTLNDYEVVCQITSNYNLIADSLLLYWSISATWNIDTLAPTGNPDEFSAFIPAMPPGTVIDYYLYATDDLGEADTTSLYTFRVLDFALTLEPQSDSAAGVVNDTLWFSLTLTNIGIFDDSYSLSVADNAWPTTIWDETRAYEITSTGTMPSDASFVFSIRVIIPVSQYGDFDLALVTAVSDGSGIISASSTLKTFSEGEPLPVPLFEPFADPTIDIGTWVHNAGATITDEAADEPSPPYSLNLDGNPSGADTLMSQAIDLEGENNIIVKYSYQQGAGGEPPDEGDDLFIEYYSVLGNWMLLQQHFGSASNMTAFEEVHFLLPPDACHTAFRLRLHNTATAGDYDDWYVDDIYVGPPPDYDVRLTPEMQVVYGASGDNATFLLTVHNRGLYDDDYILSDSGAVWEVSFYDESGTTPLTSTGTIPPTDSARILIRVAIPGTTTLNEADTAVVYAVSQGDIQVYATATMVSISAGAPGSFPWYEPFPEDLLNTQHWIFNIGAEVSIGGINPPSPPYSLNLDGGNDTVITQMIDLSGQSGAVLSYYYQSGGNDEVPDGGDYLWIDYANEYGEWASLNAHPGTGTVMTDFESVILALPEAAMHDGFQLRFHSLGSCFGCDDWFIDDIRVDFAPEISVVPVSLSYQLQSGESASGELIISNAGPGDLGYSLTIIPEIEKRAGSDRPRFSREAEPARKIYPEGFSDYDDIKGTDDPRDGVPVEKNIGGPDLFGYYWIDSDQPGGPVFEWEDISDGGLEVGGLGDDNFVGPFDIGFDFPFYDTTYNLIFIGSNGIIGFDAADMSSRFKTAIPTSTTPNAILAWLWDDLDPTSGSNPDAKVHFLSETDRFIVQFTDYPEYGGGTGDVVTAQIIIMLNGTIIYRYLSLSPEFDAASCAVGIENPDGTDGLEVAFLTPYLKDNLAVYFYKPYQWLTADKSFGNLTAGEADTITLSVSTAGLNSGMYFADISVASNDPNPASNPWVVPVDLTVSPPPYICGDANGDDDINLLDILYLVSYIYGDPPGGPPDPLESGDADADGDISLLDILYLIAHIYGIPPGPEPLCP